MFIPSIGENEREARDPPSLDKDILALLGEDPSAGTSPGVQLHEQLMSR